MNLESIRKEIDKLDKEITNKLIERIRLVELLHKEKHNNHQIIIDKSREKNILDNITSEIDDDRLKLLIKKIYLHLLQEIKVYSYKKNQNVINDISTLIKNKNLLIAGPCSIETYEQIDTIAKFISNLGLKFIRGGIFKARTNPNSFQGLGEEGLEIFYNSAKKNNLYTVSEFLDIEQAKSYYEYFDVIVVGTRNMTNFEFLKKLGKLTSETQKPIILKRGYASTVDEFLFAAEYIMNEGNPNVILCLRGIRTFEQSTNYFRFTPDLHSYLEIKEKSNLPVIFDPSHSAGSRNLVFPLSQMAVNIGFDGLMVEIHPTPDYAWSDSNQTIDFNTFESIAKLMKLNK